MLFSFESRADTREEENKNNNKANFWYSGISSDTVCLSRPHHFKFFKGCLPQILLGPFLNTLSKIFKGS